MSTGVRFPSIGLQLGDGYTNAREKINSRVEMETGPARHRNLMTTSPRLFNLTIRLTSAEYLVYENWLQNSIEGGAREFDIQLLDDTENLTWYTVRLVSQPEAVIDDLISDNWLVTLIVRSIDPPFSTRPSGTNQLYGLSSPQFFGTAKPPTIHALRGTAPIELVGKGRFTPGPFLGISEPAVTCRARFKSYTHIGLSINVLTATGELSLIAPYAPPETLVLGRFDGTNGQYLGVPNGGTLGGNWSFSTGAGLWTATKKYGSASAYANFSPGIQFGQIVHAGTFIDDNIAFTLEAWIYVDTGTIGVNGIAFVDWRFASFTNMSLVITEGSGSSNCTVRGFSNSNYYGDTIVSRSAWHHLALSVSAAGVTSFYVNGVLAGTYSIGGSHPVGTVYVGYQGFQNGAPGVTFAVDDLRATKHFEYTANFTPPSAF